jgi:hypothetical protein
MRKRGTKFRFLAAAYGRINSTWTLPNQVGWPIAKELLFTARIVGAEEAYRIGLLNHLVPRAQLRAKTMEIAKAIAGNHRGAVVGIKQLMLEQMAQNLEQQYEAERNYNERVGGARRRCVPRFHRAQGLEGGEIRRTRIRPSRARRNSVYFFPDPACSGVTGQRIPSFPLKKGIRIARNRIELASFRRGALPAAAFSTSSRWLHQINQISPRCASPSD